MGEEIDFFNVGKENVKNLEIKDNEGNTILKQIPNPNKVIMRVLHTRTEIKIYPNGNTFQQSKSWFEDKHYEVKPKPKKEIVKAKQVILQPKEDY